MDEKQSGDYFGDEDDIEAERREIEENDPRHERNADDEEDVCKEDVFIQLQLQDASDEINDVLKKFDLVLRVDKETNKYSSFAIENYEKQEVSVDYYPL